MRVFLCYLDLDPEMLRRGEDLPHTCIPEPLARGDPDFENGVDIPEALYRRWCAARDEFVAVQRALAPYVETQDGIA